MTGESIIYFAKEWGEVPTSCDQVFKQLSRQLTPLAPAIHASDVDAALTYVKHGHALPRYTPQE